jgi:type II secretory pathway component PulM
MELKNRKRRYLQIALVLNGIIMGTQAIIDPAERGHLIGDVAALFIAVVFLGWLTPRKRILRTTEDEI